MQAFVGYPGHWLQTVFDEGQCLVARYQQQLSRLAATMCSLKVRWNRGDVYHVVVALLGICSNGQTECIQASHALSL